MAAPVTDPTASFADDPHISFDKVAGKWKYETDDGKELEYDMAAGAWVPVVDEDLVKAQQAAYSVAGVDEEAPVEAIPKRKKRKEVDYTSNAAPGEGVAGPSIKRGKTSAKGAYTTTNPATGSVASSSSKPPPPSKNTAVFVSGLPPDTTAEELAERFGKFGVLMEDDEERPKIKLYARETAGSGPGEEVGTFSGEALVVYFMEDSVDLAIRMLDEAELRIGEPGTVMRVKKGEFGHKSNGGDRPTVARTVDKKKVTARINKMKSKLADWDSSDEEDEATKVRAATMKIRSVVLYHMFTLAELEEDAALLLDLKEEVREECATLGEVTNVTLYDKEPDGIMTIKFKEPLSAQACVIKMNGRFFDGRKVIASLWDGKDKFQRSGKGGDDIDTEPAGENGEGDDEKKRLDAFGKWLEEGGGEQK